jgi:hypothetical protein
MSPAEDLFLSPENLLKLRRVDPLTPPQRPGSRLSGQFIKGPIPLPWLGKVLKLRGKGPLAVALAIRFESGRKNSLKVRLTNPLAAKFGVDRKVKYAALTALEGAGLIKVDRAPKKTPTVTIIEVPAAS